MVRGQGSARVLGRKKEVEKRGARTHFCPGVPCGGGVSLGLEVYCVAPPPPPLHLVCSIQLHHPPARHHLPSLQSTPVELSAPHETPQEMMTAIWLDLWLEFIFKRAGGGLKNPNLSLSPVERRWWEDGSTDDMMNMHEGRRDLKK